MLWRYCRQHPVTLAVVSAASVAVIVLETILPLLTRDAIDAATGQGDGGLPAQWMPTLTPIVAVVIIFVAVAVGRTIVQGTRRYTSGMLSLNVQHDMRVRLLNSLQKLDGPAQDRVRTGQVVSRSISDLSGIQGMLAMLPLTMSSVLKIVLTLVVMLFLSVPLTLVGLAIVPVLIAVILRSRGPLHAATWTAQQQAAVVASQVEETVTGVRVVRAFAQEQREVDTLERQSGRLFALKMRAARLTAKFQPTLESLPQLSLVANLAVGGYFALRGDITVGTFVAFATYLTTLTGLSRLVSNMIVSLQLVTSSLDRVEEVINTGPDTPPPADPSPVPSGPLGVRLTNVSENRVLSDVSFHISPAERLAIIGPPGSGKTVLTELLGRFYLAQSGRIELVGSDGTVDIADCPDVHDSVVVVPDEPFLVSGTIRENIAMGTPDATDEQVRRAADDAQITFIDDLPDGWDTVIGERGQTLSGGQRQRVALARALLARPRVLVLDDATSAIDATTEARIFDALDTYGDITMVIVAHRSSTLDRADRILLLDDGHISGLGTRSELLESNPLFARLMDLSEAERKAVRENLTIDEPDAPEPSRDLLWPEVAASERVMDTTSMEKPAQVPGARGGPMSAAMVSLPPTQELYDRIDLLPPANEKPVLSPTALDTDRPFSLRLLLSKVPWLLTGVIALLIVVTAADLAFPMLVSRVVDDGISGGDLSVVWIASGLGLGIVAIGWVASAVTAVLTARTGERLLYLLRVRSYRHLNSLGVNYFESQRSGRIMTRMTTDIDALSSFLQTGVAQAFTALMTLFGVIVLLVVVDPELSLIALAAVPVIIVATLIFRRISSRLYAQAREQVSWVNADFQESISGLRNTQQFGLTDQVETRFAAASDLYRRLRGRAQIAVSTYFPGINLISDVTTAAVLLIGAHQIAGGTASAGVLVAFILYLSMLFGPIQQLSQVFDGYQQARIGLDRISDLLSTPSYPDTGSQPAHADGKIEFDNVSFAYPGKEPVLADFNIDVEPGETVALVGETGAGKSTVVKLLARFYDATDGSVRAGGEDIREVPLHRWRSKLGFVPQEPHLFTGTIASNISYGRPDASRDDIIDAARRVGALSTISAIPGGFTREVGERGRGLSSGQRQLIALARAELVKPELLLLDEATATLDPSTERAILTATNRAAERRTSVIVAHRLATAAQADRIYVIDKGEVIERGSHAELLKANGVYAKLWAAYHAREADVEKSR